MHLDVRLHIKVNRLSGISTWYFLIVLCERLSEVSEWVYDCDCNCVVLSSHCECVHCVCPLGVYVLCLFHVVNKF